MQPCTGYAFLILQYVGKTAAQSAKYEPAGNEGGNGKSGCHGEIDECRCSRSEHALTVNTYEVSHRIEEEDKSERFGYHALLDEDRREPEPESQSHSDKLGNIAQIDVEAGDNPAQSDRKKGQQYDGRQQ